MRTLSLNATINLLCIATALAEIEMSETQFRRTLEREYGANVVEFCGFTYSEEEAKDRLVISLNQPDEAILRAIAAYPIESLTISGGQLHSSSLVGMDVHGLGLYAVNFNGPQDVIGTLPLRRFQSNMAWTNLHVLAQISTLAEISVATPRISAPISIEPLRQLRNLTSLKLYGPWGPDISPLAGKNVTHLGLIRNESLEDLTALEHLPLTSLDLSGSAVSNISFVAGMRLESLNLSGTRVTDISVLHGMPLRALRMSGVQIADLTPLAGMTLEYLVFDVSSARKGLDIVRAMSSSIKLIGTRGDGRSMNTDVTSPADFWRRFDAQRDIGNGGATGDN